MSWLGVAFTMIRMTFGREKSAGGARSAALGGTRVSYRQDGRSGYVVFSQSVKSFEMYFEFGGGDVVACIDVPSALEWERRTGFPLEMRQRILEFIGDRVVKDQVAMSEGRYEIHDDHMLIKSGRS